MLLLLPQILPWFRVRSKTGEAVFDAEIREKQSVWKEFDEDGAWWFVSYHGVSVFGAGARFPLDEEKKLPRFASH
jgi:hypothetical protein